MRTAGSVALMGLVLLAPAVVPAGGVREINQACAVGTGCFPADPPGFPVTLPDSGSYVLTGNLDHDPALHGSTAIVALAADDISLDLNGFALRSTSTCTSISCPAGGVQGISGGGRDRVSVRNGTITGVYTVLGSCKGYRDVRRELVVDAGTAPQPLVVRCEERI